MYNEKNQQIMKKIPVYFTNTGIFFINFTYLNGAMNDVHYEYL